MRKIQEPLMLRKYADLQYRINELKIGIKLHYTIKDGTENQENLDKARASHIKPTWENVLDVLGEAYKALDEQKYDPRKY